MKLEMVDVAGDVRHSRNPAKLKSASNNHDRRFHRLARFTTDGSSCPDL